MLHDNFAKLYEYFAPGIIRNNKLNIFSWFIIGDLMQYPILIIFYFLFQPGNFIKIYIIATILCQSND